MQESPHSFNSQHRSPTAARILFARAKSKLDLRTVDLMLLLKIDYIKNILSD